MTTCRMMPLDAIDLAFLRHADRARTRAGALPEPTGRPAAAASPGSARLPHAVASSATRDTALPTALGSVVPDGIVARLLSAVPEAWARLAERVEAAHADGADVIAVAGCRRGEGRTTIVSCLEATLAARGRCVQVHSAVPLELPPRPTAAPTSITLIDAGVWFPGGPIRRGWLERQSLGCHAVILVRRHDVTPSAARETAIEAVGLRVLGEVVTLVSTDPLFTDAP